MSKDDYINPFIRAFWQMQDDARLRFHIYRVPRSVFTFKTSNPLPPGITIEPDDLTFDIWASEGTI